MTVALAPARSASARQTGRRLLPWLVLALIVCILGGAGLIGSGTGGAGPDLGAGNPAPAGAEALVRVLGRQGVRVSRPATYDGALRDGGTDATLLVYDPYSLLTTKRLTVLARSYAAVVAVRPQSAALRALDPGLIVSGSADAHTVLQAQCDLPAAARAGEIRAATTLYQIGTGTGTGCFAGRQGSYALVTTVGENGAPVTILGSTALLQNSSVAVAGNAALALGLLGSRTQLVWYLPQFGDPALVAGGSAGGSDPLAALTPGWVTPLVLLSAVVVAAAALWRGRRFGPLVVEPLPVVVRADETVLGRARLYQRASARQHALDALRIGVIGRLAARLGLPRTADVAEIARAVAELAGQDPVRVLGILRDDVPVNDAALMRLSDALEELEQRIASAAPGGRRATDERERNRNRRMNR